MNSQTKLPVNCAKCTKRVCRGAHFLDGHDTCTTKTRADTIKDTTKQYHNPKLAEFARVASIVEGSAYTRVAWSQFPSPLTTRLEEIIRFCMKMKYKKLGVAFCIGLATEAEMFVSIMEECGFEVVSVCCKTGGVPKEEIGINDSEKINPGQYETMCNPISQAEILNREGCEFNIMIGLCVGHDALFLKHIKGFTTVFAVKDRVLGHNPLAALYLSHSYYRRLRSPRLTTGLVGECANVEQG